MDWRGSVAKANGGSGGLCMAGRLIVACWCAQQPAATCGHGFFMKHQDHEP